MDIRYFRDPDSVEAEGCLIICFVGFRLSRPPLLSLCVRSGRTSDLEPCTVP